MRRFIHRRGFLGATASGLAAAVSAPSALALAASPEDPVLPLFREWVAARMEWYRYADLPENGNYELPESRAAEEREFAAFRAICDTTPTTRAGIAAVAVVLWDCEGPDSQPGTDEFADQCERHTSRLIRAVWCAASGDTTLPPGGRVDGARALEFIGRLGGHV